MCLNLGFLENLLVWLVVLCAVIALLKLVIPWALSFLGAGGAGDVIVRAINIIVFAIVAIAVIVFVFALIGCLVGAPAGMHLQLH